jgi:cytochrome c-type biogenesis protein CcmH
VRSLRRWWPYGAVIVVVGVALFVAAGGSGSAGSSHGRDSAAAQSARVQHLTSEIRCPTCRGLSAAESDSEAAQAIRAEVARQVAAGRSDGQILSFMVDRYGSDILERPPASGFDGLVWALPVAAVIVAVAALAIAFRRWHRELAQVPTADDQAVVARALREDEAGA